MTYPEIYVVLHGEAIYYLQKVDEEGNVVDAARVDAKAGDILPMPPDYGHITINTSKTEPLIMMNWVDGTFSSVYGDIVEHKGGAYYFVEDAGKISAISNPVYAEKGREVAPLKYWVPDDAAIAELTGLSKGEPVYDVINYTKKLAKLRQFLSRPYEIEEELPRLYSEDYPDLKGPRAPETDPLIKNFIEQNRVVEIVYNEKGDTLSVHRVDFNSNYIAGKSEYIGKDIPIGVILNNEQQKSLLVWIKENTIRGPPIKFRIVIGNVFINDWQEDFNNSNIAHVGREERVIYIGQLFLQYLFSKTNEALRIKVLDEDELRHIEGEVFQHDTGVHKEIDQRKDALREISQEFKNKQISRSEELNAALLNNTDINYWDNRISDVALSDPQEVTLRILLHRGLHNIKVLNLGIPQILLSSVNWELLTTYIAATVYNTVIHKGAEDIIIITDDKSLEDKISKAVKEKISQKYRNIDTYGNFGREIRIMNSNNFRFEITKELFPEDILPEPKGLSLGVDIGGTEVKTVVMDGENVIYYKSVPTDTTSGIKLKELIFQQIKIVLEAIDEKVEIIGITFPASIEEDGWGSGRVVRLTNYERYWSEGREGNTDFSQDYSVINTIAEGIKEVFGSKYVAIMRDAKAFGFWEVVRSAWSRNNKSITEGVTVVNPIGTGPGYVEINKGIIERIPHQGGHMVVDLSDRAEIDHGCGVKGCYGAYVSGNSDFVKKNLGDINTKEISNVLELLKGLGEYIAREAAKAYDITGAKNFVITGGVTENITGPHLLQYARTAFVANYPHLVEKINIILSDEPEKKWAGAKGAAQYANMISQKSQLRSIKRWDTRFNLPESMVVGAHIVDTLLEELRNEDSKKYCILTAADVYQHLIS